MTHYIAKKPDQHGFIHFTPEENETWQILYQRQIQTIHNRACDDYLAGLKRLNLAADHIPQCKEVSTILTEATGWSVVPVDALIPLEEFFTLLANRQFPAASFIRIREELDYIQEPDIFHELFGHCPMITHQPYADFLEWYGKTVVATDAHVRSLLGRLFWFTIEFGLVKSSQGLRIYGGGILSSHTETIYALEDPKPKRLDFDLKNILNNDYRYDQIQNTYYVIDNLSDLMKLKTDHIIEVAESISANPDPKDDFVIC